jgi:hypothetical protein
LVRRNGGLHDYQDCNNDPRDGCEDTNRWCQVGQAENNGPRLTQSDKCSKAAIYYCSQTGFDIHDAPCSDPATGLFLDFPAPARAAVECWDLYSRPDELNVEITNFAPYCDRNATHLDTRGDCVFECKTLWQDCNNLAADGCEANITELLTCDYECIDCEALSGIERTEPPPTCVTDSARPGRYRCNFTCPGTVDEPTICVDRDGKWENGCEVANLDFDDAGVFMNEFELMDCSIMQAEARKNPWLFRHHLHIDLTKKVPTKIGRDLPAGSIFCDNNLAATSVSGDTPGKCVFTCIDGFINADRDSWNGCEGITSPFYPHTYGGYWIGDPHVEDYLDFLGTASGQLAYTRFITFPRGVTRFNERTTTGEHISDNTLITFPLWY